MTQHPFLSLADANAPFADQLIAAAARVIRGGCYIGGAEVEALEREIATLCGTDCCVGVSNGLDALRLILLALIELGRLDPGDEVIFPTNTFIATALAIRQAGLTPVATDVDPHTMLLTADTVEPLITQRTRAILPVHLYGRVCADPSLLQLAQRHSLLIVEDAAQAIGATGVGRVGVAAAFSFYPTKNLGALGDAGAVVTSDPDLARTMRSLANYGASARNSYTLAGYNCRLDPIQAAMLRVKLPALAEENRRRRAIAATYHALVAHPLVELPQLPDDPSAHVWHQFVVTLRQPRRNSGGASVRDALQAHLLGCGIATDVHYPVPVHRQTPFAGAARRSLPVAERLAGSILSLPIGAPATAATASAVAAAINAFPLR